MRFCIQRSRLRALPLVVYGLVQVQGREATRDPPYPFCLKRPSIMATDSGSAGQGRNARKRQELMEKDNVSAQEIKTEDVYRKCCSCHMMKTFIDVRGVHRKRDFDNHKLHWCCLECMSLEERIARIQDSARAILGWNDLRWRSRVPGWYDIIKNERARFMERAAGLMKDDLRKAIIVFPVLGGAGRWGGGARTTQTGG